MWDIYVQCDNVIEARRLDKIAIDKRERKEIIMDIAVPAEERLGEKGGKIPGFEERDWKIGETQNGRSRTRSDRSQRRGGLKR